MQLIVVTGLSGSGKSIALNQLEDLGFYCIDNLPGKFLVSVASHLHKIGRDQVAVSLDSRSDVTIEDINVHFEELKKKGVDVRVLCLTASTDSLVRRYSETRRQHPLSRKPGNDPDTLIEAIEKERKLLEPLIGNSHLIDTTGMLANTLRQWVRNFVNTKNGSLILTFESFGFKRGLPMASDLVFDVRCLPNPYWDKDLREYTGKDEPVIKYLESFSEVKDMIDDIEGFVKKWLPFYQKQNRPYLTVSIGCTGGQHRSVYIAEQLAKRFSKYQGSVIIRHRTLDAGTPEGDPKAGSAK